MRQIGSLEEYRVKSCPSRLLPPPATSPSSARPWIKGSTRDGRWVSRRKS